MKSQVSCKKFEIDYSWKRKGWMRTVSEEKGRCAHFVLFSFSLPCCALNDRTDYRFVAAEIGRLRRVVRRSALKRPAPAVTTQGRGSWAALKTGQSKFFRRQWPMAASIWSQGPTHMRREKQAGIKQHTTNSKFGMTFAWSVRLAGIYSVAIFRALD